MILQSLVKLAEHEGLVENPNFQVAPVSWSIEIEVGGRYLGVVDLREPMGFKTKRLAGKMMNIPARSARTVNIVAECLVDKLEYVIGLNEKIDPKTARRQEAFLRALGSIAIDVKTPSLESVVAFLRDEAAILKCRTDILSIGFANNDLVTFRIDAEFLHDGLLARSYWDRLCGVSTQATSNTQCVICGKNAPPVSLHPKIKNLRGASTSGVPMVSFNADAFYSYGWESNENAPVCQMCATGYASAVNRLLSDRTPDPRHPGEALTRQSIVLSENLTAIYWTDSDGGVVEDLLAHFYSSPEEVKAIIQSVARGERVLGVSGQFHLLLLQGAEGRATVRSYHADTLGTIVANIERWQAESDTGGEHLASLYGMLSSLAVKGEAQRLPNSLSGDLFLAAVFGRMPPFSVLQLANARCRVTSRDERIPRARAALLQIWLTRWFDGSVERKGYGSMEDARQSTGYSLGKLLAICEDVQRVERKSLNRTLSDRYYSALSTRPAAVLGRMMDLNRTHLARMKNKGLRFSLEQRIAAILKGMDGVPQTLDLVEQGLFALGFYHEKWNRQRAVDKNDVVAALDTELSQDQQGEIA